MRNALDRIVAFIWNNLGNCSTCMRTAFQAAVAAWSVTLFFRMMDWSDFVLPTFLGAIALTILWTAHVLVYARKAIILGQNGQDREVIQSIEVSRRAALRLYLRILSASALLSATPAFAQFPCDAGTGSCTQTPCESYPCRRPCYVRGNNFPGCIECTGCGQGCGGQQC